MHPTLSSTLFLALAASPLASQQLLDDILATPIPGASGAVRAWATADGNRLFFPGNDRLHGEELWVTDGTSAGTHLIEDVSPGSVWSSPLLIEPVGGGVVYGAGVGGPVYWTDATTTRALPVRNGWGGAQLGNSYLFAAQSLNGGSGGVELWSTDGTVAGTQLVRDIVPGGSPSNPFAFTATPNVAFFLANGIAGGTRVYASDGTTAGTGEVGPAAPYSAPTPPVVVGNLAYFGAIGASGGELWVTDGTPSGTTLVAGGFFGAPDTLTAYGASVLFRASDGVNGLEPFVSDGTAAGTFMLRDIHLGGTNQTVEWFYVVAGLAFFPAWGTEGPELWRTDGTTAGTQLVLDIRPGTTGSDPKYPVEFQGELFFVADDGTRGAEVWRSDGTAANTRMVANVRPDGLAEIRPFALTAFGSQLFFIADDGVHGREPWVTDGSAAGTSMLRDIHVDASSSGPDQFTTFVRDVVFWANDGVNGREPFFSDGTMAGTVPLGDLDPGPASSRMFEAVEWNGRLWMNVDTVATGRELWVTQGTPGTTNLFYDLVPGTSDSFPREFTPLGDKMLFAANLLGMGRELLVTDGTVAGTQPIDLDLVSSAYPQKLSRIGDDVLFVATHSAVGQELWKTDGTQAGTTLLADIHPGPDGTSFHDSIVAGGRMFMDVRTDSFFERKLWTSDGTVAGTYELIDFNGDFPFSLVSWQGKAWFGVDDFVGTPDLWCSDGTVAGTQLAVAGFEGALVPAGDLMFWTSGDQLWATDGVTRWVVVDFAQASGALTGLTELRAMGQGTRVTFTADDGVHGREMWTSDGTAAGTMRVTDVWPGATGGAPGSVHRAGSKVYFTADDGVSGYEPWVMPLSQVEGTLLENFGSGCPGSNGIPRATATGLPEVGGNFFAGLVSALPNSPAVFVLGLNLFPQAGWEGCGLAIAPPSFSFAMTTSANGSIGLSLAVANDPALLGQEYFFRWFVLDAGGGLLGLLSASDLLHFHVGR